MKIADLKTYVVENPPPSHGGQGQPFRRSSFRPSLELRGEVGASVVVDQSGRL